MADDQSRPGRLGTLVRRLVVIGPHRGAHRVAARAGISVLVPLLGLVLLGRYEWTAYAAFGAFTSLYGRTRRHAERTGMQAVAGAALVLAVTIGTAVSLAPGSRWLTVVVGAAFAAFGSLTSDAYHWHPPGPVFLVFGLAVCAMIPTESVDLLIAPAIATASALFSLVVGHIGVLRDPEPWTRPVLPRPLVRETLRSPGAVTHLVRYVIALGVAGGIATALGWTHPYWAMVAGVVVLSGPDLASRLTRGAHRVVGTLLGVGATALLLPWSPGGVVAVLVIVALQAGAELMVGRNYALALVFITPLALMMGQLVSPAAVGPLLRDRFLETVLGAVVASAVLFLIPDRSIGARSPGSSAEKASGPTTP